MNTRANEELRKYRRFPFREHILIDGSKRCISTDISEGGLFVSGIQHFEEKSIVEMVIPFKEGHIEVKGQVQFYQAGIGIGINFIELTDRQRAKIHELINSLAEKPA